MKNKTAALLTGFVLLLATPAYAGSATWNLNPTSSDWNTAANWTPNSVPNGSGDKATFDVSSITSVGISANTEVDSIVFDVAASSFTITASPSLTLTMSGTGIVNDSGTTQDFITAVDQAGNRGNIFLTQSASAGSLTVFTNKGGTIDGLSGGSVQFLDNATASNATFINKSGSVDGAEGGTVTFFDAATAGNGTFTNEGGRVERGFGLQESGLTEFLGSSSAGNGTFTNNGGISRHQPSPR